MDQTLIPTRFFNVTPSDTTYLGQVIRLHIGGAGTLAVVGSDGVAATFTVIAGQVLPGAFKQVKATGTTATLIVALCVF